MHRRECRTLAAIHACMSHAACVDLYNSMSHPVQYQEYWLVLFLHDQSQWELGEGTRLSLYKLKASAQDGWTDKKKSPKLNDCSNPPPTLCGED